MFAELLGLSYIGFCSFIIYKAVVAHAQFDSEPLLDFESVDEEIQIENENKNLKDEIEYLKERIKSLEKENIQWYIKSKIV
jgi:cell division protein FtsB